MNSIGYYIKMFSVSFRQLVQNAAEINLFIAVVLCFFLSLNFYWIEVLVIGFILSKLGAMNRKVFLNPIICLWWLALACSMFSIVYSISTYSSIQYCLLLLFFCSSALFYMQVPLYVNRIVNLMLLFCSFHVIATLFEYFFPSQFFVIASYFMNIENLGECKTFYWGGSYCGFNENPAPNAFYISLFILLMFNKMFYIRRRVWKLFSFLLFVIGFWSLVLTNKRGLLLSSFTVIFVIWLFYYRKSNHKMRYFLFSLFMSFFIYYFAYQEGVVELLLAKNIRQLEAGDITNGRIDLWQKAFLFFDQNPMFGIGIRGMTSKIGDDAHNIYIQLLAEVGFIGSLVFYLSLLLPLLYGLCWLARDKQVNLALFFSVSIQILFLLNGLTGNPLFDHRMMWIYAVSIGILGNEYNNRKQNGYYKQKSRNINISKYT